ncbi:MAG TPA: hypothetical protein VHA33_28010 [Candidatus Angelobacter sp.]|jgi:hypothetical protein|nr:hypothetical protein [Candidatus Angelobacter sp.]
MKKLVLAATVVTISVLAWTIQQPAPAAMQMHHAHATGAPVSYAELKDTVAILDRARKATEKYQDVRIAQEDGYQAIGPDVPGMGIHFVHTNQHSPAFDAEHPPILLYESNASVPGGYSLVGVSYLLAAPEGPDGQPLNAPLPKSLAAWHRHENICVLPDRSTSTQLTEKQCREQNGRFSPETPWMVHAWIWKESPLGVFSPTNPAVR